MNSTGSIQVGRYRRLNYELKRPYFEKMQALCKKLGIRFYVSDAHHKEKCHNGSCCGLPGNWNYSRGQFTHALMIAKKKGKVRFSDISPYLQNYRFIRCRELQGLGCHKAQMRAKRFQQSIYDIFREFWNTPKSGKSPYKYFAGVLVSVGLDKNGDVIYKFDYEKARLKPPT